MRGEAWRRWPSTGNVCPLGESPGPTTSDVGNEENLGTRLLLGWRGQPATVPANVILLFLGLPGQDRVGVGGGPALEALTWGQSPDPWCTVPPPTTL